MHPSRTEAIRIDGSYGEGGGQILRTSLALSCVFKQPVELRGIRKTRRKPGLQPQHLTAVRAAAAISGALVEGAEIDSTSLLFRPAEVKGGDYSFDVSEKKGSAGSTSLVLQTVLLPLSYAATPSSISVVGGTHVPWSPPFHYLKHVFLPMLVRLGVTVELDIDKWGWYPVGGGRVTARIRPGRGPAPVMIIEQGELRRISGISAVSNLPTDIAVRQKRRVIEALNRRELDIDMEVVHAPSPGKGTFVFLSAENDNIVSGFDALGAIGKPAEEVAEEACRALFEYLDSKAALDPHLADQIIPYLALCSGASEFTTSRITRHLLTNIWVVEQFADVAVEVEGKEGEEGLIRIVPGVPLSDLLDRGVNQR